MREYLSQLEATILDLGAEVCSMKSELREVSKKNQTMQATLVALKELLDEKGILSQEDFDLALVDQSSLRNYLEEFADEGTNATRLKKAAGKSSH